MDRMQSAPDMLILKAVSLGPLHGYGVLLRFSRISGSKSVAPNGVQLSPQAGEGYAHLK
jgi:hypothetical protein